MRILPLLSPALLASALSISLLTSCRGSSRPSDVLSPSAMEAVLTDYHLALALAAERPEPALGEKTDSLSLRQRRLVEAVYAKHGITAKEFNASMLWYSRHPLQLQKLYTDMAESSSSMPIIASGNGGNADTLTLWQVAEATNVSMRSRNYWQTVINADTSLRQGDQLRWCFTTTWRYHEGQRRGTAVMAVTYASPDTTTYSSLPLSSSGTQSLSTALIGTPRTVRLFILQQAEPAERLRMLSISENALLRMRTKEPAPLMATPPERPESMKEPMQTPPPFDAEAHRKATDRRTLQRVGHQDIRK